MPVSPLFRVVINTLGDELIPALEQGLAQGPAPRRHPRGPGWPGRQGLPGQLVFLHQQVAGFGPHEHGPLGHQAQQELMVPAARLGQFGDDLGLPPAHGQAVLVEAHPVKRQGQGVDGCLDFRPDLVNGRGLAGQSGAARFLQGGPGHRFLERAHIRLGMDDGKVDQRPGISHPRAPCRESDYDGGVGQQT